MLAVAHWEDRNADPIVKYMPGDSIPDDHPKRGWLLRSEIAVTAGVEHEVPKDELDDDVELVTEVADPVDDDPVLVVAGGAGKPKPTDSIEKHREYATKHGIDPKGLSRAQLVKAIRDL